MEIMQSILGLTQKMIALNCCLLLTMMQTVYHQVIAQHQGVDMVRHLLVEHQRTFLMIYNKRNFDIMLMLLFMMEGWYFPRNKVKCNLS